MKLKILYLFPHHLNIYGDRGNILTLQYRAYKRGIEVEITEINSRKDKIPEGINLIFGGGGQDKQQEYVSEELMFFKEKIKELIFEKKASALLICGTYQLFGHYFRTHEGKKIKGISVFDLITVASAVRKIGNVVIRVSDRLDFRGLRADNRGYFKNDNLLVGFENHSGNTYLNQNSKIKNQNDNSKCKINESALNPLEIRVNPSGNQVVVSSEKNRTQELGVVLKGFGNNGQDGTEGAITENCIGTYLHGPLLPKNPQLADWLIAKACPSEAPSVVEGRRGDDTLELQTREKVIKSAL